jgi:hypothetical protein
LPLTTLLFLTFGAGIAAALAAGSELRLSPRPALLTRSFAAFGSFLVLLLVPVSVYFYVFHGDWFLLYALDVRKVPSALALMGFAGEAGVGVLGFLVGSVLARAQRNTVGGVIAGLCLAAAGGVVLIVPERLGVVGSYAQYHGGFGLTPYRGGALMQGSLVMGVILLVGVAFLLWRLRLGSRDAF